MRSFSRNRSTDGLTFIEVLIALAVLAIIALILLNAFSPFKRAASVESAVQIVLISLEEARTKTLASENESVYGVYIGSEEVIIFKGSVYNASDPENETRRLPSSVTVSNVLLNGGGTEIIFDRLTGATSMYGTITVSSSAASESRTVTVERTGVAHQ